MPPIGIDVPLRVGRPLGGRFAVRVKDVERFNQWAADYERSWLQRVFFGPVQRSVLDLLAAPNDAPLRLLDVGCGTGALLRQAAVRFPAADLYGVDPAPQMVRVAQALGEGSPRLHALAAAAQNLPFGEVYFDFVVSTFSFHHWGDQAHGLREARRVLRPGGSLILADTFAVSWKRAIYWLSRSRDRFHTEEEVEELLAAVGFEVLSWTVVKRIARSPAVWAVLARRPLG
jgi:SAM-dependent methyltransferase